MFEVRKLLPRPSRLSLGTRQSSKIFKSFLITRGWNGYSIFQVDVKFKTSIKDSVSNVSRNILTWALHLHTVNFGELIGFPVGLLWTKSNSKRRVEMGSKWLSWAWIPWNWQGMHVRYDNVVFLLVRIDHLCNRLNFDLNKSRYPLGLSISRLIQNERKTANFARLYYQHFTTLRNETLEYYSFCDALSNCDEIFV
jgi:hypothetical protein